jgi:acetyl-CoA acetyltransferase
MICVCGVGETAYSRRSGRSVPDLATEASRAALADAGLAAARVDAVIPLGGSVFTEDLMAGLGLPGQIFDASPAPGGNAAVSAVRLAESMIGSGTASCVLIVLARNGSSGARIDARARLLPGQQFRTQLEHPHGWSLPAQWYAMICRRHMAEYGTTKDQLAAVALSAYRYAQANPRAMRYGRPLTPRQYHEADMIADPYQRYDCCLETDGAAAIVVAAETARPQPAPPAVRQAAAGEDRAVPVLAVETARPPSPDDLTNRPDWHHIGLTDAARAAWERAGVGPADLDAAMIYDCFTFEVIHQLEEAGFCPRGEGGPFVASGALDPGGRLPVNPHGGLLAEGHLGGLNHVIEAVRQLRGEAAGRQLAQARLIGVTGWGDWGDGSLAILGRPPVLKASPATRKARP